MLERNVLPVAIAMTMARNELNLIREGDEGTLWIHALEVTLRTNDEVRIRGSSMSTSGKEHSFLVP